MTVNASAQQDDVRQRVILRVWLNAFIPVDLEGAERVSSGPHAGKTMLSSPGPVDAWFLTDQRGFSDEPTAHSRMHSEFMLALPTCDVLREDHCCDDTVQVDPETGEELCRETPDTADMAFSEYKASPQARAWTCTLSGSTRNACLKLGPIKVSPNLDYRGVFNLAWSEDLREVTLVFDGLVETYPAFEMYASLDGGPIVPVFRLGVEEGTTPANLAGAPTRSVLEQVKLTR